MTGRSAWALAAIWLVACTSEDWVLAPDGAAEVEVPDGVGEVTGVAVLSYAAAALPDPERVVSNALRVTADSSLRSDALTLTFDDAPDRRVLGFADDGGALNLDGVYQDCGARRCEVEVPLRIARSDLRAARITVEADAILTVGSLIHELTVDDDRAWLEIVLDPPSGG